MLELKGISRSYGRVQALRDLDLTVPDGTLFGLMGQNGAGKTTLLKIIAGILAPDRGELWIDGVNAMKNPAAARMKIGYVPDEFGSYDSLTVMEYMELNFLPQHSACRDAPPECAARSWCGTWDCRNARITRWRRSPGACSSGSASPGP